MGIDTAAYWASDSIIVSACNDRSGVGINGDSGFVSWSLVEVLVEPETIDSLWWTSFISAATTLVVISVTWISISHARDLGEHGRRCHTGEVWVEFPGWGGWFLADGFDEAC